ncbi:uncharacterized protein LOC109842527 [Asparagus officinalis]|uniref:uncharacterized protein LOC109842527 n=1 Tax=Asparagus officinalis TaxID=4686 RepID=UPI00098E2945|nr:uncharacterized protein LOC109842527 [Asparagus officinalis]
MELGKDSEVRSIEGRVGVYHLVDAQQSMNLTFKSNREGSDMYCLNSLNFHPERVKRDAFTIIRPRYRRSEIESKSNDRCFKEPPPPNWIKINKSQIPNKETNDRTTTKNPRATEGGCCCNINNFNEIDLDSVAQSC